MRDVAVVSTGNSCVKETSKKIKKEFLQDKDTRSRVLRTKTYNTSNMLMRVYETRRGGTKQSYNSGYSNP